jgi:Fe-S cluster assembly protein SufD
VSDTATTTRFTADAMQELARRDGDTFSARDRRLAFQQFDLMDMPSPDTEEWRYTDLTDFDLGAFEPLAEEPKVTSLDDVAPHILEAAGDVGERDGLAVQHNSTMVVCHLGKDAYDLGVHFESIDAAIEAHPELVEGKLHEAVTPGRTKFSALHAAYRTAGSFILVPKNAKVERPIQTLTYVDRDGLAVFPHTLIILEEGAELTFVDRFVSPDLERVLSNAIVEIHAGPGSKLRYVCLQEWGAGVTHLGVQRALIDRDAEVRSLAVAFGGSLARAEAESIMEGDGGSSEMLGLYFGDGDQHFDHRSIQDHVGSNTASDLLYKGALKGHARAIYSGTVIIEAGAHKCDAYQTNRNVLLSETAKADSIPNLEILTNDPVRCGHAASVGPVDEDTMFYIQSRGIPEKEAERLVVGGFFQEVLDKVDLPEIRSHLEGSIARELESL